MTSEETVKLTAQLYEMRDAAKMLLGPRYRERMDQYADAIRQVQEKLKLDPMGATLRICKGISADGYEVCLLMAAVVEILEPIHLQHGASQDG